MHVFKAHDLPPDSIGGIAALSVVFHHFVTSRTFNLTFPKVRSLLFSKRPSRGPGILILLNMNCKVPATANPI